MYIKLFGIQDAFGGFPFSRFVHIWHLFFYFFDLVKMKKMTNVQMGRILAFKIEFPQRTQQCSYSEV